MNGRTIVLAIASLTAVVVFGAWALVGDAAGAPDVASVASVVPTTAASDVPTLAEATSAPNSVALAAGSCSSTDEPHLFARGVITAIDGVPIALQGQTTGLWLSMGNAVSITAIETGGPAVVTMVAVLAADSGAFQTYNVGHDSRGAYAPPDPRAPENYLTYDAAARSLVGTVGVSIEAVQAGEIPPITPAEYTTSEFAATYDAVAGTIVGTLAHPDLSIEFTADEITSRLAPVYSSPECFLETMEAIRGADNPAP